MFKRLNYYYVVVSLPFVLLLLGVLYFHEAINSTIIRNPHPQINYAIFCVILFGGVLILVSAYRLMLAAKTIVDYSRAVHTDTDAATLQKMADSYSGDISYVLQMLAASGGRSISHQEQVSIEHELENARTSLHRRNALPQYLTGLLVGMGLLGTFIGLLATLTDISTLISSFSELDMSSASPLSVFRTMIDRMKAPMQSMSIAFSASMYGLLGSIVLGLMMVGIRRMQGDISSLLGSEVARHIEISLSHESAPAVILSRAGSGSDAAYSGEQTRILLRIEERLTEAVRLQQRALSAELDDFQKQRAELTRTLAEQTEASNNFRNELQQLGRQLGDIFNSMDKGNGEISTQISELTVHLTADARESHKLLSMQVDEQKKLRDSLDSYKIEERLAEAARLQQRALSAEMADFQKQRADMLRTLAEQTEASNNFRSELQQLGRQLGEIFNTTERGTGEIYTQISELTVHLAADAKESQKLLSIQAVEQRRLIDTLDSYKIGERLAEAARLQQRALSSEIDDFQKQRADMLRTLADQTEASNGFRNDLQQLGRQLGDIFNTMEKSNSEIFSQISELMVHITTDAKESHKLLAMQVDEQKKLRDSLDCRTKSTIA